MKPYSIVEGNMLSAADVVGDIDGKYSGNTFFVLADPVNVNGAAGAGIARMFASRYPVMCSKYVEWCASINREPSLDADRRWRRLRVLARYGIELPAYTGDKYKTQTVFTKGDDASMFAVAKPVEPVVGPEPMPEFTGEVDKGLAVFVMNTMPAENFGVYSSYEAITASLEGLRRDKPAIDTEGMQYKMLVLPAVGCGVGLCSWEVVKPILCYYADRFVEEGLFDHVLIVEPVELGITDMTTLKLKQ